MLDQITIFLLFILIVLFLANIFKKRKSLYNDKVLSVLEKYGTEQIKMQEKLSELREQNKELRQEIDGKLTQTQKNSLAANEQTQKAMASVHIQSQKIISEVSEKLTKLDETNKQVVNFSAQLQNLQDILKNPKQRGVLGEYYLEETLKNVLPPNSYEMQYGFADGTIVDAVVKVKDKIIPVDSKFSLENYERLLNASDKEQREKLTKSFKNDLKIRIDETSKYVKPNEGTMEFAFMFIPSESIYYDLLVGRVNKVDVNSRDLIDYAFKDKKVIIVSPTSFLAYLQTVLQGLRALQIEESAKEIKKNVEKLGKHILSYDDFMRKLGSSMSTTVNHYNNAYKEFKKIDKDVIKIAGGESKIDPLVLEKPKNED